MPTDAEQALAFAARREGTSTMPAAKWAHVLSLELGWMAPAQARAYIAGCLHVGLLDSDGDDLRLTFDEDAVELERGFRPGDSPPARTSPEGFSDIVGRLAAKAGVETDTILDEVAAWQDKMGGLLDAETAALVVARQRGLTID